MTKEEFELKLTKDSYLLQGCDKYGEYIEYNYLINKNDLEMIIEQLDKDLYTIKEDISEESEIQEYNIKIKIF